MVLMTADGLAHRSRGRFRSANHGPPISPFMGHTTLPETVLWFQDQNKAPKQNPGLLFSMCLRPAARSWGLGSRNRMEIEELMSSGHRKQGTLAKRRLTNQENQVSRLEYEKSLAGSCAGCLVPIWWQHFGGLQNL